MYKNPYKAARYYEEQMTALRQDIRSLEEARLDTTYLHRQLQTTGLKLAEAYRQQLVLENN